MRLKDVMIGSRYRARVSGSMTTIRVTELRESSTFGGRARTTILAVNEATGRTITIRSAQRLHPLPAVVHIGSLAKVDDLPAGKRAVPEADIAYDLRLIDGQPLGVTVRFVFRRGDELVARASDGQDYAVSGTGAYILCPAAKRKEAAR